ncbi:hypothetical protein QR685DRAFT_572930 [Neurospora intermedia]|uniref:Uncharacterized protein n=1 Tax=Neurospora intermedia TaxID=5142 RepID=A0ABR3DBH3_NEUIN
MVAQEKADKSSPSLIPSTVKPRETAMSMPPPPLAPLFANTNVQHHTLLALYPIASLAGPSHRLWPGKSAGTLCPSRADRPLDGFPLAQWSLSLQGTPPSPFGSHLHRATFWGVWLPDSGSSGTKDDDNDIDEGRLMQTSPQYQST